MEKTKIANYGPRRASDIDSQIGRNLKKLRRMARLSQQDVGALLGVTFQQVQKYESGANRLPLAMLLALKTAYDVPWDYFFAGLQADAPAAYPIKYFDEHTIRLCQRVAAVRDTGLRRKIAKVIEVLAS